MSITITDGLVGEFKRATQPVKICTPNGFIIGTFTPCLPEPDISEEEMQRIENDTSSKWYTAAEVEAKLQELRRSY